MFPPGTRARRGRFADPPAVDRQPGIVQVLVGATSRADDPSAWHRYVTVRRSTVAAIAGQRSPCRPPTLSRGAGGSGQRPPEASPVRRPGDREDRDPRSLEGREDDAAELLVAPAADDPIAGLEACGQASPTPGHSLSAGLR